MVLAFASLALLTPQRSRMAIALQGNHYLNAQPAALQVMSKGYVQLARMPVDKLRPVVVEYLADASEVGDTADPDNKRALAYERSIDVSVLTRLVFYPYVSEMSKRDFGVCEALQKHPQPWEKKGRQWILNPPVPFASELPMPGYAALREFDAYTERSKVSELARLGRWVIQPCRFEREPLLGE